MAGFDPWAQTHAAQNNLNSTILTLAQLKRQSEMDAMDHEDRATSRKVANLNLATAQRGFDDQTTLRDALAAARGGYAYPEPQGVGPMQPGQEASLSSLAPQQQPASAMDRMRVAADLAGQGNTAAQAALPQMAQVIDMDDRMAQYQVEVEAGGGDRQAFLKQKMQFEQGKEMMKTIAPMAANPATRKMAEKALEWYKQQQPENTYLQNMTVADFAVENDGLVASLKDPETGKVIGYNILDPYTNKSSFHMAPKEPDHETWGDPYESNVGGKKVMLQKSNRGQVRAVAQDASTTVKVTTGGGGHGSKKEPDPTKTRRPMPAATEKRLTASADLSDSMDRYNGGFKDEYAGHYVLGEASNTAGKIMGDDSGQAQWWQDYQGYVNEVRHEKFGASLTANEKSEFLKYVVTPRMSAKEVKKNLERQKAITDTALARVARGYARQYDPQTVQEFIGREIPGAEAAQAPQVNYGKGGKPQPKQPGRKDPLGIL